MDLAGVFDRVGRKYSDITIRYYNNHFINLKSDTTVLYEHHIGKCSCSSVPNYNFVSLGVGDMGKFIVCRDASELFFYYDGLISTYVGYDEVYLYINEANIPEIQYKNGVSVGDLIETMPWRSVAGVFASGNVYSDKMFRILDLSGQSDYIVYNDFNGVNNGVNGIAGNDNHFSLMSRIGVQNDLSLGLISTNKLKGIDSAPFKSNGCVYLSKGCKTFFWTSVMGNYGIACNTKDAKVVYTGCSFLFNESGVYKILLRDALRAMV